MRNMGASLLHQNQTVLCAVSPCNTRHPMVQVAGRPALLIPCETHTGFQLLYGTLPRSFPEGLLRKQMPHFRFLPCGQPAPDPQNRRIPEVVLFVCAIPKFAATIPGCHAVPWLRVPRCMLYTDACEFRHHPCTSLPQYSLV